MFKIHRKRILWSLFSVIVLRAVLKFRKKLKEWRRVKKLVLKLPHKPAPKEVGNSFDFYGTFKRGLPNGFKEYNELEKHGAQFLIDMAEEFKDEGVFLLTFANPKAFPFFPGFICVKGFEETKELLSSKNLSFLNKSAGYENMKDIFGKGILNTVGEKWYHQRVVVEKAFTDKAMRKQFHVVVETVKEFIDYLKGLDEIPVHEVVLKVTLEILGRVAFTQSFGSFNENDNQSTTFFDSFSHVLHVLIRRGRLPYKRLTKFLPLKENRDYNKSLKAINDFVQKLIDERRSMTKHSEEDFDLLDYLLGNVVDSKGNKVSLTDTEIFDSLKTLLLAGHETTAGALTWLIYLCGKHPEIATNIREEFETKLKGEISFESIEKATYLNSVVLEVLRLYPTTLYARVAKEDLQIGKYVIPSGVEIMFLPHLVQRDGKYYKNPYEFVPDRWVNLLDGELGLQAKIAKLGKKMPFTAFSLGARNCVGRKLALLELRVISLLLITTFDISLPAKQPTGFQELPYLGFTFEPRFINVNIRRIT